ncbi:MAG TPA: flagellar assembly protein T N-terminal domain-containing protein [Syntrophales bacterium]|nr:flagellar assembly protein T N-terminal domain-containing protein [Syntrophales bacterium]
MKRIIFPMIFSIIFCISLSNAEDEKQRIMAVGMAVIHNNIIDIARDKAVDNALRTAVERVVGVMVTGSTEVENFQLKLDRILSESRGFIDHYKIISEKRDGDNYEVNIEAEVVTGRVQDRLKAVELLITRKSKPRLMIIVGEQAPKDAIAEATMSKYLLKQGFKLVDASTIKKSRSDINLTSTSGNEKVLSSLAQRYGAEILIVGAVDAASNSFSVSGIEMYTNKVTVSLKVINSDTGDIITTDSESLSAPGPKGDIKKITENAVEKLTKKIVEGTLEKWSSELTNTITVKLIVAGLNDYQDLLSLKDHLPLVVKGFKALYQRSYQRGEADLDMEIKGDIQGLADDLAALVLNGKKLKILELTPNKIGAAF